MKIEDIKPGICYRVEEQRGFKLLIPYKKAIKKSEDKFNIPALLFNIYNEADVMDVYSLHKPDHMFWLYKENEDKITKASSKTFRTVIHKLFSVTNKEILI